MPDLCIWVDYIEKLEAFTFDDPADPRVSIQAGDNQMQALGRIRTQLTCMDWNCQKLHPNSRVYGS